jgi:hypothetical protein
MNDAFRSWSPWQFGEYELLTTLAGSETGTRRVGTMTRPLIRSERGT